MARSSKQNGKPQMKTVNLALQGGGAHGAFAWGVLDRLLEEERIAFEGISATSAGAMNAVIIAEGLVRGGREGARELLATFWYQVSRLSVFSPAWPTPFDRLLEASGSLTPTQLWFDLATRVLSPYQFNPLNYNPLKELLADLVDFGRLRRESGLKLFLSATNLRSGKIRIFTTGDLSVEAVLASSCLPFLFQAVELEGEAYWDGGYMGNPAIYPLIYDCESQDVVVVHINPIGRDEIPRDAAAILDRVNEISFNSSLMREMRAIAFVTDLIDNGQLQGRAMKRMLIHAIEADEVMAGLGLHSKLAPDWTLLQRLRDEGRNRAEIWLEVNHDKLGKTSSVDIKDRYL